MGGKGTDSGSGVSPTGARLFGSDGMKGLGNGIQQASSNYLQQQAQGGDPNASGAAQGAQAIAAGLAAMKNKPVDMTKYVNRPNVIPSPMNNPAPPNLFVPGGQPPITTPMFNPSPAPGFQMNPPITSPMGNGFNMNQPITSPMANPSTLFGR